ncbi:MAG: sterol desaturase family protein [Gammaproteobacteria bacterium]|nr:MAG: sterol desaturase family protein [Gammaproteobacteria bacterium]RLA31168.1 MAG: sterol desaturase family protein [Gammaproteobacteria bacterium]
MSDAFFNKLFGDSQATDLGTGWVSGTASVFFGLLGLGGVITLHFPGFLTLPEAREFYPIDIIRMIIQGTVAAALVLGAISAILRERKVLGLTGVALGLAAALFGGASTALPEEVTSKVGIGFDWFLLDLMVMTLVFVPLERLWPRHPEQSTFRPEWTTDTFYFVATHLPAQLTTFAILLPATFASKWFAIPALMETVGGLPFIVQFPLAIVMADLFQYGIHRAFHQFSFLWPFHAVHHSIKTMDWIAGSRSHFVDILITRGLILIPMTLLGFSQGVMAGYLVFVAFHATFSHTDFRPRTRWLEPYFVTCRYHHWHHAADPDAIDVNFAIHFPFIDRLFGTYHLPEDAWPERYGLIGSSMPPGFFRQFVFPFKRG